MGHKGDGMQLEGQLVVFMLLQHWFSEWPEFPLHRGARSPGPPCAREILAIQRTSAATT